MLVTEPMPEGTIHCQAFLETLSALHRASARVDHLHRIAYNAVNTKTLTDVESVVKTDKAQKETQSECLTIIAVWRLGGIPSIPPSPLVSI